MKPIRIWEVGPRDGLQDQPHALGVEQRVVLVEKLLAAGAERVEAGAFVAKVPQMHASDEVCSRLLKNPANQSKISALVPNMYGLKKALSVGLQEVAIFFSATQAFSKANLGRSQEECFENYKKVVVTALAEGLRVRAYLSVVWGCPYEKSVSLHAVLHWSKKLLDLGVYELCWADTVGCATPGSVEKLLHQASRAGFMPALHLHQNSSHQNNKEPHITQQNILCAVKHGVRVLDASVGGIGGCPYAPGASGNICTQELVKLLKPLYPILRAPNLSALDDTYKWLKTILKD